MRRQFYIRLPSTAPLRSELSDSRPEPLLQRYIYRHSRYPPSPWIILDLRSDVHPIVHTSQATHMERYHHYRWAGSLLDHSRLPEPKRVIPSLILSSYPILVDRYFFPPLLFPVSSPPGGLRRAFLEPLKRLCRPVISNLNT